MVSTRVWEDKEEVERKRKARFHVRDRASCLMAILPRHAQRLQRLPQLWQDVQQPCKQTQINRQPSKQRFTEFGASYYYIHKCGGGHSVSIVFR